MKFASISALLLTAALAGCGDNATPTAAPAPAPAPTAAVPATPAPPAGDTASAMDAAKLQAEKLLTDAATYAKENKLELADKAIAGLEELRPKLPAEYGPKIDQVKKLVESAKAAAAKMPAGVKIPG